MSTITLRCCLKQSGNIITLSSIGGGTVGLDFDDSEMPNALMLVTLRDVPLMATFEDDPDGSLIQRRGRPKKITDEQ